MESTKSADSAEYIQNIGRTVPSSLSNEYIDHITALWNDNGVRQCYHRANEFQLIDNAK